MEEMESKQEKASAAFVGAVGIQIWSSDWTLGRVRNQG